MATRTSYSITLTEDQIQAIKVQMEEEQKNNTFEYRHNRRAEGIQLYGELITSIIKSYPKQRSYKVKNAIWAISRLKSNPLFDDEDLEYEFIQKFYRGMWGPLCDLLKDDPVSMDLLVKFAKLYEAFDY
jgi:ATP-dependent protease HslVU (ClpYQ) ATPase subunit